MFTASYQGVLLENEMFNQSEILLRVQMSQNVEGKAHLKMRIHSLLIHPQSHWSLQDDETHSQLSFIVTSQPFPQTTDII